MSIADTILDAQITFRVRPVPVPCLLRPTYRMAQIVLLVDHCYQQQSTMLQIQVLNWAIRNTTNRLRFVQFLNGQMRPDDVVVRFDPTLSRAITFAIEERVMKVSSTDRDSDDVPENIPLTLGQRGTELLATIREMEDVLVVEKNFLSSLGKKISRKAIASLFPKE